MIKIGVTGQSGFVGTHLLNSLNLKPDKFTCIPFEDNFFDNIDELECFVGKCDVIVHLAAMNRHNEPDVIYKTNIELSKKLIDALNNTNSTPYLIFSSSTQESLDNLYGNSKKECRLMFENWAIKNNAGFTGFIIPNIFGPFGHPYYNSVIATFCHQLTHNEKPKIIVDNEIHLIYVAELVKTIISKIDSDYLKKQIERIQIEPTSNVKVTDLLRILESIKRKYIDNGELPSLSDEFEKNVFNTFLCYIDHKKHFPFKLNKNSDNRGFFVETIKLNSGGQVSFSTTEPGITRGNHFHTRKTERFAVIKGKALIEIRRIGTNEKISFILDGETPSFVDMPIWYTHSIKNIGNDELFTFFWINEHFNADDTDTFFEVV